ncbi:MAG: hypothetical protein ACTSRC_15925 [Candidatus Helarchaeota archaeon]
MEGSFDKITSLSPVIGIHELDNFMVVTNVNFMYALPKKFPFTKIGPLWVRWRNSWRYAADGIKVKILHQPTRFSSYHIISNNSKKQLKLLSYRGYQVILSLFEGDNYLELHFLPKTDALGVEPIEIQLAINFDKENAYDYINFSGNLYKKAAAPLKLALKVPAIGTFSQVWSIHSKDSFIGLIGTKDTNTKEFSVKFSNRHTELVLSLDSSLMSPSRVYIPIGPGDMDLPVQLKYQKIDPIKSRPFKYKGTFLKEALKSHHTLIKYFLLKTPHGAIPANFIFPPEKEGKPFKTMKFGSYGNCFSLGYIYGTNALYRWTQDDKILKNLTRILLPPILKGAQIQNGPLNGAFYDTYNAIIKRWTTGRVQFPTGGFSDWFPYPPDRRGGAGQALLSLPRHELSIGGLSYLFGSILFTLRQSIKSLAYVFKRIPKRVIFPAYTGQFAYFLLQILHESSASDHYLGQSTEHELKNTLNRTATFLKQYQRADWLWDHELFEDGTVFWSKRTLACIYPATFLYWWGLFNNEDNLKERALGAIEQCIRLLDRGEYYGVYFETNLAIHQDDLVTGLACIKCFTRLYELTHNATYLVTAQIAAWHVLSYMWGNGVYDQLNNCITGGIPVTTYKSLGFPVIGGSELCQTIEALLELSRFDRSFLRYARAAFSYHSHYLYESTPELSATREIIWGIGGNWSTSTSADFASYATGPFIRALYLYSHF